MTVDEAMDWAEKMTDGYPRGAGYGNQSCMQVLAAEVRRLNEELAALYREIDKCVSALPVSYYMDQPDGGDVSVSEQMSRIAEDAWRYRQQPTWK